MTTMPSFRITLGVAIVALVSLPPQSASTQSRQQRVDTTFAFERGGSVSLSIVSGEIRVRAHDRAEIRIIADVERGRLETSFSRTRVSIEARDVNRRLGEANYELVVPVGTRVHAGSVSGDITIQGTGDEVEAHTVSGDVLVEDASRVVDVGTVSGSATLRRVSGRVEVGTVAAQVLVDGISGDLSASTVAAHVDVRNGRLTGFRATTVSGGITYDGTFTRDGRYDLNTHSGAIRFALPANAGADLELETFSGSISSDFPLTLQPDNAVGRRARRMQFTIGEGGARIRAETFSGSITIRRLPARPQE